MLTFHQLTVSSHLEALVSHIYLSRTCVYVSNVGKQLLAVIQINLVVCLELWVSLLWQHQRYSHVVEARPSLLSRHLHLHQLISYSIFYNLGPPIYIIIFALHISSVQVSIIYHPTLHITQMGPPISIGNDIPPDSPFSIKDIHIYHCHKWVYLSPLEIISLLAHLSISRIYITSVHLIWDIM
jgi:hypothetical protein